MRDEERRPEAAPLESEVTRVPMALGHVPDDEIYKIAAVLHEAQDKLAGVVRAYARYDKAKLARDPQIPFHPGAIRYYRERGAWRS